MDKMLCVYMHVHWLVYVWGGIKRYNTHTERVWMGMLWSVCVSVFCILLNVFKCRWKWISALPLDQWPCSLFPLPWSCFFLLHFLSLLSVSDSTKILCFFTLVLFFRRQIKFWLVSHWFFFCPVFHQGSLKCLIIWFSLIVAAQNVSEMGVLSKNWHTVSGTLFFGAQF